MLLYQSWSDRSRRNMFKWYYLFVCVDLMVYQILADHDHESPFTAVVKKTLIATAHSCMKKINATDSDLEHIRSDPPYPEKASCIIKCLLEKVGIVKHNKYSKAGFMDAVSPLVLRNKKKLAHMETVSENCEKEINHHHVTPCQLGNEVTTCIFKYAPELHFKA